MADTIASVLAICMAYTFSGLLAGPSNPLLESGPSTSISVEGRGGMSSSLNRAQHMYTRSASDRFLINVFARINRICERRHIPQRVHDRCDEMFKQYYDVLTLKDDGTRVRSLREEETAQIIAGVLFLSCRMEGVTRTYKEITAITGVGFDCHNSKNSPQKRTRRNHTFVPVFLFDVGYMLVG